MRKWMWLMTALMAVLFLLAAAAPALVAMDALADQVTTPTDLTTPAETEAPRSGKRSGYALIRAGAKVYTSRKRNSVVGTVTADSYVYIPQTSVASLTYKVRFDTGLSESLSECHTYYVLSEDVRWLSESEGKALAQQLTQRDARVDGGVRIPVIAFDYRKPPKTPTPTATPKATATPKPTATPRPTATAEPTSAPTAVPPTPTPTGTPVPIITPSPRPTATPGITTETDLLTPTATPVPSPTETPAAPTSVPIITPSPRPTATPGITTETDLTAPTATPVPSPAEHPSTQMRPGIATETDLAAPEATETPADAPALLSADEMYARLNETHPDRQVTLWVTCTDPDYVNGSRLTLFANVTGYDGLTYTVVWEVDKGDGNGFVNAGVDGMMSLSFIIDDENACWNWRVGVRMDYQEK